MNTQCHTTPTPSSSLNPFNFESQQVRIITIGDDHWFVAKDVADALGYQWNGTKTIGHVPDEWKGVESDSTPGGKQDMLTLSEQGLYFFLGRSDKPKALPFQKWIAGQVLPAIRKTGQYQIPQRPTTSASPSESVRGLSYRECAKALGVSSTAIARWVRDGNIQPEPGGGIDLEKVREIGHQKWDKYGHHGYNHKCGLSRPGMTPRLPVNTGTNRMEAELNHGSSQTLTIHQLIDKTISNILASKRERYRQVITERLLDEYGTSKLEDVPVKSAKPNLEIFAVLQEAHLEQREGTGDQIHMDPDELERVMLQIAVEGIQKVKRHISQRVEQGVPYVKKTLRRSSHQQYAHPGATHLGSGSERQKTEGQLI